MEKEKAKKPITRRKNSEESSLSSSNEADENDSDSDYQDEQGRNKLDDSEDGQKFSKRNDGSKKKAIVSVKPEEKTVELKDIESIRLTRHMLEKMVFI